MRHLIFSIVLLFTSIQVISQDRELGQGPQNSTSNNTENDFDLFNKGRTQIGGFAGGGGTNGNWQIFLQGRYGKFLLDCWNTGLDGSIVFGNSYNQTIVGPYTRYYFLKKPFSPVVEVSINYLNENQKRGISDFTTTGTFSQGFVGLSWISGFGNLGGDFLLNYNLHYDLTLRNNNNGGTSKLQDPRTIGFTYRINYFF